MKHLCPICNDSFDYLEPENRFCPVKIKEGNDISHYVYYENDSLHREHLFCSNFYIEIDYGRDKTYIHKYIVEDHLDHTVMTRRLLTVPLALQFNSIEHLEKKINLYLKFQ